MIEHDYFGALDELGHEAWSELIEANEQQVNVSVRIVGAPEEDALDRAAAMVMSLEAMDWHARELLVAELASGASIPAQFAARAIAEIDEDDFLEAINRESGDRVMDLLRSLRLESLVLTPNRAGSEEAFAVLRYVFAPDVFEPTLAVTLDDAAELVSVDIED
ncbi:MAG TPA: DUF2004 domain-containing protein [Microbacteriaceae bacterium]|nr:DUF2004 domain-containing protein [Microbacteriaceae bacterium]